MCFFQRYRARSKTKIVYVSFAGTLRITDVTAADSGSYTCVADNNRGNSYGDPANVDVKLGRASALNRVTSFTSTVFPFSV